jgi:hypothetical protein
LLRVIDPAHRRLTMRGPDSIGRRVAGHAA